MSMSRTFVSLFSLLFLMAGAVHASTPDHAAVELVRETTDKVIKKINADRQAFEQDQQKIFQLVDEVILPHFDFERMSKWVLGRYWRQATPEQRKRFEQEFKRLLVRTYATALTQYSDQEIEYLPVRERAEGDEVMVRTEIRQGGGYPIPISYNMYKSDSGWQVYDVTIEGVSLVSNYRSSFAGQIRAHGLDKLIAMLAERNSGVTGNPGPGQ